MVDLTFILALSDLSFEESTLQLFKKWLQSIAQNVLHTASESLGYGCSNVARLFGKKKIFLRKKYLWFLQKFYFSQ